MATANADGGSLGYLTNSKVRGRLKRTQQFTGTNGAPVWQGSELNGTRAIVSNQVPSNLTKGTIALTAAAGRTPYSRPELRVFYTYATWNENAKGWVAYDAYGTQTSGSSFGIQAESWW